MTNEELAAFLHLILPDNDGGESEYVEDPEKGGPRWIYWTKFDCRLSGGKFLVAPYPSDRWGDYLSADEAYAQIVGVLDGH